MNQTYPTGEVVTNSLTAQDWLSGVSMTMGSTTLISGAAYTGTGGANGLMTSASLAGGLYQYSASFDALARAYDINLKKSRLRAGPNLRHRRPDHATRAGRSACRTT